MHEFYTTRIRSITDRLCCIVVKEIKIFFILDNYYIINTLLSRMERHYNEELEHVTISMSTS